MEKAIVKRGIALIMIAAMLASCSPQSSQGAVDKALIASESARLIDQHLDDVKRALIENGEVSDWSEYGTVTGESVTRGMLTEENGEEYLSFLYNTEHFESVDEVFSAASSLVTEDELKEIKTETDEIELRLMRFYEEESRALNDTQRAEFYKDIRKLVIKSAVLLTAAIVYALVPNTVFWGKVTAATAVSIAAGVAASAIMRVIEYYNSDKTEMSETFSDWLKEMSTEPTTAWAIAAGVINTGKSMGYSPVTTAIILAVFAIYGITDDIKPILEEYNFKV